MTLDRYREFADRVLGPIVGLFQRVGLTPDGVSVVAFVLAAAGGGAFLLGGAGLLGPGVSVPANPDWYLLGALLVFLSGVLDLLDGQLARRLGTESAAGDLLDHVLDRYADIVLVAGLAAGVGRYTLGFAAVTGVLMTSYLGTQAQAVGLERVYGGLIGRADRLALICVAGVVTWAIPAVPGVGLSPIALLLGLLALIGHLTALQRFWHANAGLD